MSNPKIPDKATQKWVARVHEKYPERFDTSDTIYKGSYHKVSLRCIEHDTVFECSPVSLLRSKSKGDLCPQCHKNRKLTSEEFISKAKANYEHLYDLSKVEFKTTRDYVTLGCSEHGDFQVYARYVSSADSLTLCPKCKQLSNNTGHTDYVKRYTDNVELGQREGTFYRLLFTHIKSGVKFVKVGITSLRLEARYSSKAYKAFKYEVIELVHTTNLHSAQLEAEYIKNNINKRFYLPSYIEFEGRTECFEYDEVQQLEVKSVKFVRDSLLEKQLGKCSLCNEPVKYPVVDHWHQKRNYGNGLVRSVVCSGCNILIAAVENNLTRYGVDYSDAGNWIKNLADYLEDEQYPMLHPSEKPVVKIGKRDFKELMDKYCEKYPKRNPLKYPKNGKASARLQEVIKEFKD